MLKFIKIERIREKMSFYFSRRNFLVQTIFYVFLAVFFLTAFEACQKKEMKDPVESLKQNAETYWNKRFLKRDYDAIYKMEADQKSMTRDEYMGFVSNKGQIAYVSIEAKAAKVEGSKGTVDIVVTYSLPNLSKKMSATMKDQWMIKDNEWKHVLNKKIATPSF